MTYAPTRTEVARAGRNLLGSQALLLYELDQRTSPGRAECLGPDDYPAHYSTWYSLEHRGCAQSVADQQWRITMLGRAVLREEKRRVLEADA